MDRVCCLAGIDPTVVPMFGAIFATAGESRLATIAPLNVPQLGRLRPNILVCDVDASEQDALELLRQIRFVLPECLIAVYTGISDPKWRLACHLAGANGVLSKQSNERQLARGLSGTLRTGCYSDPHFAV